MLIIIAVNALHQKTEASLRLRMFLSTPYARLLIPREYALLSYSYKNSFGGISSYLTRLSPVV